MRETKPEIVGNWGMRKVVAVGLLVRLLAEPLWKFSRGRAQFANASLHQRMIHSDSTGNSAGFGICLEQGTRLTIAGVRGACETGCLLNEHPCF